MKTKRTFGFTMVELLISMVILVLAFGLVTYLYTRAARIRKIVVVHSEVQQVLSQVMDTLTYGEKGQWGIIHGTEVLPSSGDSILELTNGTDTMEARIDQDEQDTVTVGWGDYCANKVVLDAERKIIVKNVATAPSTEIPASRFEYFNHKGESVNPGDSAEEITLVKITLWAGSTDPAFKDAPAVPLMTAVRLRNKYSL